MGRDTKGDNLVIYPNGGAHCFACGFHLNAKKWTPKEMTMVLPPVIPKDLTHLLPVAPFDWLCQYLNCREIEDWNFQWSPTVERIFLMFPGFYWARSLKDPEHKVITQGKRADVYFSNEFTRDANEIIVVEDPISAIKLARDFKSYCLFGSVVPNELYNVWKNEKHFTRVVFWLDYDKFIQAQAFAARCRNIGINSAVLCSKKDPKAYSSMEIRDRVGPVLDALDHAELRIQIDGQKTMSECSHLIVEDTKKFLDNK